MNTEVLSKEAAVGVVSCFTDCFFTTIKDSKDNTKEVCLNQAIIAFCNDKQSLFEGLENFSLDSFAFKKTIKEKCNEYANEMLTGGVRPYSKISRLTVSSFKEVFYKHYSETYKNYIFPEIFVETLDYIFIQNEEFDIMFTHYNKALEDVSLDVDTKTVTLGEIKKVISESKQIKPNLKAIEESCDEKIKTTQERVVENEKKTYEVSVTILAIFSAIILAFNGGITLSASSIEALPKVSPYRLAGFVLLLGFVLINVFFFLLHFITVLVTRVLQDSDNNKNKKLKRKGLGVTFWLLVNFGLIFAMLLLCFAWYKDVIGIRNNRLTDKQQQTSIIATVDTPTTEPETVQDKQ